MAKPRLVKVRALFYVLQHITKRGYAYFDTAPASSLPRATGVTFYLQLTDIYVIFAS